MPDTYEEDVRAALTKVELGEVDAALVYASDVRCGGDAVEGIEFPEAEEAVNDYPIACSPTRRTPTRRRRSSTSCCPTEAGRRALEDAGFRAP